MKYPLVLKSLAAAALCTAAAMAQDAPAMPLLFGDICADRHARVAGGLAYLEATLSLTAKQQPLFEHWRKIKLASVKEADCTLPPAGEPSIIDSMKHEEKMLRSRLAELKAETPALEALIAALTPEQKRAFGPVGHPPIMMRPGRAPRHGGPEDGPSPEF